MAYQTPFFGYTGAVWDTVYSGVNYLGEQLSLSPTAQQAEVISLAMLETCLNGLDAINAARYAGAWAAEQVNIAAIQALPISIDPTAASFLNARASTYAAATSGLAGIVPSASSFAPAANVLGNGIVLIPDMGLLSFYQNFAYETPPSGLTAANFVTQASGVVSAFNTVAQAIALLQGANLTQAYDTATRQSQTAAVASGIVADFTGPISSTLPVSGNWNQLIALPALATDAAILSTAPFLLSVQQASVARYAILQIVKQLALFLLVLRSPQTAQINTATILNGETLMDVAARTLGDFEEWQAIAALNRLVPPYIAATGSPGVAAYGGTILLPTPGAAVASIGTAPSYINNFLGIDIYTGPINGVMPPWSGDFQTIAGYNNLAWALGRRLQTTLGTLIYHNDYGSRIPPEVGAVQTQSTAGQIAAFGKSALLSDPRVQSVLSAIATLLANGEVSFTGIAQPAGFGNSPVSINEVINPVP